MAESLESKKHPATALRRRRAHDEGVFPRSQEWTVALTWLAGMAMLQSVGPYSFRVLSGMLDQRLGQVRFSDETTAPWHQGLWHCAIQAGQAILPLLAGLFCMGLAVHFAQAGFRFRLDRLAWDSGRLMPRFNAPWNTDAWVPVLSGLLKLALILGVLGFGTTSRMAEFASWSELPLEIGFKALWQFLLELGWYLGLGWLVLAGVDYSWNYWRHERALRMTDSELREELRETQGDPSLRSRRRRILSD
ncbi:MAG: EscU/YscU/HrcU family type III secretion system export apparatus switch protein [Planctomycetota bacterium]